MRGRGGSIEEDGRRVSIKSMDDRPSFTTLRESITVNIVHKMRFTFDGIKSANYAMAARHNYHDDDFEIERCCPLISPPVFLFYSPLSRNKTVKRLDIFWLQVQFPPSAFRLENLMLFVPVLCFLPN